METIAPHIVLTDPVYRENKKESFLVKWFTPLLNDKRDMAFIYLALKITFLQIPFAVFLFVVSDLPFYWYIGYLVLTLGIFLGPYVLMLHNICHRKLFKKKYSYLNKYIPWGLGIFFGQTPETYFHHHVIMHHPENNQPEDLSSTMKYRRDSVRAFGAYLLSFYFTGVASLVLYFKTRQRSKYALRVAIGEVSFFVLAIALCFVNFKAAITVFILPLIFIRFAMMAGNWAQHAFIDVNDPANIYKNSITCINTVYNKKCFNDGYHIGHHLKPYMHWTEMPENFKQTIDRYRENKAIVFSGLDYFQIWFLLMTKNYAFLAKRFVPLEEGWDRNRIIAFLKQRTQKCMV